MKKNRIAIAVITIVVLTCSVMFADASTSVATDKVITKVSEGKFEGIKKNFSEPCLIFAEDGCVVVVKVVERDGRRAVLTRRTTDQYGSDLYKFLMGEKK